MLKSQTSPPLQGNVKTLNEFILERQKDFKYATGELSRLLSAIGLASKVINREVNKAGLVNILGSVGNENVQGEDQQKLDVYANNQFINAFKFGGEVCVMATEENEGYIAFDDERSKKGKYAVAFDPLDGSSNIDVNVSIGSIFSIYRRISPENTLGEERDLLQKGRELVAAGYVIYGSSTMLVYTTGNGVNGFTLDPSIGEYCLSHPNIKMPEDGSIYSVNEGNYNSFNEGLQKYIDYCKRDIPEIGKKPYSARYIGSMVADVHRNLLVGGIFVYPATAKAPSGKLRLLYECNPMAYIVEQAGGRAIVDKDTDVLDVQPVHLHQRVPIIIGSKNMVQKLLEMQNKYDN